MLTPDPEWEMFGCEWAGHVVGAKGGGDGKPGPPAPNKSKNTHDIRTTLSAHRCTRTRTHGKFGEANGRLWLAVLPPLSSALSSTQVRLKAKTARNSSATDVSPVASRLAFRALRDKVARVCRVISILSLPRFGQGVGDAPDDAPNDARGAV